VTFFSRPDSADTFDGGVRGRTLLARVLAAWVLGVWIATSWAAGAVVEDRPPSWASLTIAQQQALAPLKSGWASIDAPRKQKWLEVAARFPSMPADERARVQERMAEWSALTPAERSRARLQFQETRQIGAEERQARWQAYQALSDEERRTLAQAAKPAVKHNGASSPTTGKPTSMTGKAGSGTEPAQTKRNIVVPVPTPPARAVAPTVVQAKPGVTTTTMATRAQPPAHHQAGLPKIVATPGFVDPATLLPKRGPQGAAVRAAASSDPTVNP
jgi:hypothetical protein